MVFYAIKTHSTYIWLGETEYHFGSLCAKCKLVERIDSTSLCSPKAHFTVRTVFFTSLHHIFSLQFLLETPPYTLLRLQGVVLPLTGIQGGKHYGTDLWVGPTHLWEPNLESILILIYPYLSGWDSF